MQRIAGERLPERLLEIVQGGVATFVKLVHGKDLPSSTSYATVSHRWGESHQLLLSTRTEAMLYAGFPVAGLAPLFQDIIGLLRRLKLLHLWIDTLCIKQDDPEEWVAQAVSMYSVYLRSTLNITASHALHNESLFSS